MSGGADRAFVVLRRRTLRFRPHHAATRLQGPDARVRTIRSAPQLALCALELASNVQRADPADGFDLEARPESAREPAPASRQPGHGNLERAQARRRSEEGSAREHCAPQDDRDAQRPTARHGLARQRAEEQHKRTDSQAIEQDRKERLLFPVTSVRFFHPLSASDQVRSSERPWQPQTAQQGTRRISTLDNEMAMNQCCSDILLPICDHSRRTLLSLLPFSHAPLLPRHCVLAFSPSLSFSPFRVSRRERYQRGTHV